MGYSIVYDSTSVTFTVEYEKGYDQYRVFIREGGINETGKTIMDTIYDAVATFTDTCSGLTPNTLYTINCRTIGSTGWMGAEEFTTEAADSGEERPEDWSWSSAIAQGVPIEITATDWNNFCATIDEFRVYAGLPEYGFTTVSSGMKISAAICNEAWYAIDAISGHGTMPDIAVRGGDIYASFFTGLRNALNSIP